MYASLPLGKEADPVAIEVLQVDPRTLRLPLERSHGVDHRKFWRQVATHGKSTDGMPPLWVSRGKDGELQILDGVTRATRVAKLLPGQSVTVEVTDEDPNRDYSSLPTIGDRLP